jgi:hypothetical protein
MNSPIAIVPFVLYCTPSVLAMRLVIDGRTEKLGALDVTFVCLKPGGTRHPGESSSLLQPEPDFIECRPSRAASRISLRYY